jgi:ribosome assembly protein YihI (activator of Der GTPase)
MNEKDKLALTKIQPDPELEIIELDDRLDMAVDSFGLLALNDQFFADNCDCTNSAAGCGQPVPQQVNGNCSC